LNGAITSPSRSERRTHAREDVLIQIGRIQGCTRVIGQSQGYLGLPLRDVVVDDSVNGPKTPAMETAWLPTPGEIAAINAGAPIILRVFGTGHPPVMVYVGQAPE
jgi:hypothetical protein